MQREARVCESYAASTVSGPISCGAGLLHVSEVCPVCESTGVSWQRWGGKEVSRMVFYDM